MNAESNTFKTTVEWDATETASSSFLAASPSPMAPPARGGELLVSAPTEAGPESTSSAESEKAYSWTNPVLSNVHSLAGL